MHNLLFLGDTRLSFVFVLNPSHVQLCQRNAFDRSMKFFKNAARQSTNFLKSKYAWWNRLKFDEQRNFAEFDVLYSGDV